MIPSQISPYHNKSLLLGLSGLADWDGLQGTVEEGASGSSNSVGGDGASKWCLATTRDVQDYSCG